MFGEVIDKGLDVCRDGLVAPGFAGALGTVVTCLPEWVAHLLAALVFVLFLALARDVIKHEKKRHAHAEPSEERA